MAQRHLLAKVAGLAAAGFLVAAAAASGETLTFTLPADPVAQPFQRWTVPAGVCSATFDLFGAEGSGTTGGAEVTTTLPVVPGTPYDIYIGGEGFLGKAGYNGGGAASNGGVGGGGATDVRDGPGFADRVLVAGGGGGNGGTGSGSRQGDGRQWRPAGPGRHEGRLRLHVPPAAAERAAARPPAARAGSRTRPLIPAAPGRSASAATAGFLAKVPLAAKAAGAAGSTAAAAGAAAAPPTLRVVAAAAARALRPAAR